MGAISDAMAAAARAAGATIRTGSPVARITLEDDARLRRRTRERREDRSPHGRFECRSCKRRCSGCSARVTSKPASSIACVTSARRALAAKLHLALDALPAFARLPAELAGERLVIAPDLVYLEHAFDHAKYGQCSPDPALEITIPSVHDKTLAPAGKHVLSAIVQYAPHDPRASGDGPRRELLERTLDVLERHAPGLRRQIVGSRTSAARGHRARIPHHGRPLASRRACARPVHDDAARCRARRSTPCRSADSSSAARAAIRAAASWDPPAAMPRTRSSPRSVQHEHQGRDESQGALPQGRLGDAVPPAHVGAQHAERVAPLEGLHDAPTPTSTRRSSTPRSATPARCST